MEENKNLQNTSLEEGEVAALGSEDTETPLDKNVRLMSPTRMLIRRFFRSKLSVTGLIMLVLSFINVGAKRKRIEPGISNMRIIRLKATTAILFKS